MSANSLGDVHELSPFRFWCQRVLPLVYDDNLSYYELLCKVVDYINNLITDEQQLVTAYDEIAGIRAAVDDLKADLYNTLVTDTASGSIASFSDGADGVPVKTLKVNVEPVQSGSGDPSPDNVRPISGHDTAKVTRTGKNVLPIPETQTSGGITLTRNSDGTITLTGTSTAIVYFDLDTDFDSSLFAGYEFSGFPSGYTSNTQSINFRISSATSRAVLQDFSTGQSNKTIADNGKHLRFAIRIVDGYAIPTGGLTFSPMLRKPTESSDFEPYTAQTVTIDLNGTIYGGTLDVTTGVLTVDRGIKTITENTSISRQASGSTRFYVDTNDMERCSNYVSGGLICDRLKTNADYGSDPNTEAFISGFPNIKIYENQNWLYFSNGVATSVEDIKTWLVSNPLTVVYPLANPFTVQLTAQEVRTLLAQNNVFADCGDVSVEYRADTKLYIQKLTAPTEDDMIADANIVSGTDCGKAEEVT